MSDRKVTIETKDGRKHYYRVSESGAEYALYSVDHGLFSSSDKKIGKARNLEDAIALAKASISGAIRNVDIH